jgi:hypothetical protein
MSINDISNPDMVLKLANHYYGKDIFLSNRKNKKYAIEDDKGRFIHFGSTMGDYTKHKDAKRRQNYLTRASNIKGDWAADRYSPNVLSIVLLWDGYDYLKDKGIL